MSQSLNTACTEAVKNCVLVPPVCLQVLVLILCATIFGCFVYELAAVKPVWLDVAKGFIPTPEILTNTEHAVHSHWYNW